MDFMSGVEIRNELMSLKLSELASLNDLFENMFRILLQYGDEGNIDDKELMSYMIQASPKLYQETMFAA